MFEKGYTPWNKGKKLPEETRRRISIASKGKSHEGSFKKGGAPWNKGKKYNKEQLEKLNTSGLEKGRGWNRGKKTGPLSGKHKEKIRIGNTGKIHSEESKKKMRAIHHDGHFKRGSTPWNKGEKGLYTHSEETKKKLSTASSGENHPMYGKTHSEEARRKISLAGRGKKLSEETKRKLSAALKGRRLSKEHREKISGKNSSSWKGGVTTIYEKIRKCLEYRQWRSDVFTRDDFTCQECGAKSIKGQSVYLHAHHIKEFSTIMEEYEIETIEQALECTELWNINNGKTLCGGCHHELHWGKKEEVIDYEENGQ